MSQMDAEREQLFHDVAGALTADHSASTGDIAAAAGVSRATLHRVFGNRDSLVEAVYGWLLRRCDETFDAAGVDPADRTGDATGSADATSSGSTSTTEPADTAAPGLDPVLEVFDRLVEDSYPLAQSLWLLIATPSLEENPELLARLEEQDRRLEKLFLRGQEEGVFRTDLPSRWLGYTLGAQVMSAWYLVDDGYAGAKDVPRMVRTAILDGLLTCSGQEAKQ